MQSPILSLNTISVVFIVSKIGSEFLPNINPSYFIRFKNTLSTRENFLLTLYTIKYYSRHAIRTINLIYFYY